MRDWLRSRCGKIAAVVVAVSLVALVVLAFAGGRNTPRLEFLAGIEPIVVEGSQPFTGFLTGKGPLGSNLRYRTSTYKVKGTLKEVNESIAIELAGEPYKPDMDPVAPSWSSLEEVGGGAYKVPAVEIEAMKFALRRAETGSGAKGPLASFDYTIDQADKGQVFVEIREVFEPTFLQRAQDWLRRLF